MQRNRTFAFGVLCASCLSAAAMGQEVGVAQGVISAQRPAGTMTVSVGGGGSRHVGPAVTGMPYSAEQVTENVQTLADGTHIRQKQHTVVLYRDSAGRTRTETPIGPVLPTGGAEAKMVRIVDVVGGYEYTLDDQNKTAHRVMVQVSQPMAARAAAGKASVMLGVTGPGPVPTQVRANPVIGAIPSAVPPAGGGMPRPEVQSEDLGVQSVEGVTARGRRMTETWPVDSIGNDRPIVVVRETWFSDQLGMMVLSKNNDPRHGESTTALKNLNLAEPDPALFQPPPGYQIVDENGSFQMALPRPSPAAAQKQ